LYCTGDLGASTDGSRAEFWIAVPEDCRWWTGSGGGGGGDASATATPTSSSLDKAGASAAVVVDASAAAVVAGARVRGDKAATSATHLTEEVTEGRDTGAKSALPSAALPTPLSTPAELSRTDQRRAAMPTQQLSVGSIPGSVTAPVDSTGGGGSGAPALNKSEHDGVKVITSVHVSSLKTHLGTESDTSYFSQSEQFCICL
jgi:hypothetical protein